MKRYSMILQWLKETTSCIIFGYFPNNRLPRAPSPGGRRFNAQILSCVNKMCLVLPNLLIIFFSDEVAKHFPLTIFQQ